MTSYYLIYKLKKLNDRLKIVDHTHTLENAFELIKQHAKDYMNKKNENICDKTTNSAYAAAAEAAASQNNMKSNIQYIIEKKDENEHTINVIKKTTMLVDGWVSSDIKQYCQIIASFSYTKYKIDSIEMFENIVDTPKINATISRSIPFQSDFNSYMNPKLLKELEKNKLFNDLRKNADNNNIQQLSNSLEELEGFLQL